MTNGRKPRMNKARTLTLAKGKSTMSKGGDSREEQVERRKGGGRAVRYIKKHRLSARRGGVLLRSGAISV